MRLIEVILLRKCLKLLETPKVMYTTTQLETIIVKVWKIYKFYKINVIPLYSDKNNKRFLKH